MAASPLTHGDARSAIPYAELFERMIECRLLEKRAHDLFLQNLVKGTSHLGIGQEAIAAAFGVAMAKDDWTFCTYRGHNHTLARGAPMVAILGELMGRECGLLHGKGGSMHLTDVDRGAMGSYAIVGAHLPIAMGAAWTAKIKGMPRVAVAFFGDGTTNIGAFHEAINMAVVLNLPVVFVCENNQYMEYTPIGQVTAVTHPAADRASAYGLPSIIVDGNDVEAVYSIALKTLERARTAEGPSLIECKTYRHGGHSRADPAKYRPPGELEAWLARDPIVLFKGRMLEAGVAETVISSIEADVARRVDDATAMAKASPVPSIDIAESNVWADGTSTWRN